MHHHSSTRLECSSRPSTEVEKLSHKKPGKHSRSFPLVNYSDFILIHLFPGRIIIIITIWAREEQYRFTLTLANTSTSKNRGDILKSLQVNRQPLEIDVINLVFPWGGGKKRRTHHS